MTALPQPTQTRWQPLRVGLVDIFYYDNEEFWFRDGNLLLRGNNGTGKSKVMALTLPFLLDGQLTPSRVEPDGDPGKRMEWNLLLGGDYQERLGYCWLEFARLDDTGTASFCTLGCGMRAVAGRGAPDRWFFVTPQRIGLDLYLMDNNGRTLSRDRLTEALGSRGRLFTSASAYRQTVDEQLFRLGKARYDALLNLLIQLRQPQLSKRPNEDALSAALTEALPPLDQAILNDVADAFRNLEADRDELDSLVDARKAVGEFLTHYCRYAGIAARRRGTEMRRTQSAWDKTSGELNLTRQNLETAVADREREQTRQRFLDQKLEQVRTRDRTLRESPEMRDARRLEDSEQRVAEHQQQVDRMEQEAKRLSAELAQQEQQVAQRSRTATNGAQRIGDLTTEWARCAALAGFEREHINIIGALDLPNGNRPDIDGDDSGIDTATNHVSTLANRRRDAVAKLRALNQALLSAIARESETRDRRQSALDEADQLDQDKAAAEQELTASTDELIGAMRLFLDSAAELRIADAEALLADLRDWAGTIAGDNPAQLALRAAFGHAQQQILTALSQAEQTREAHRSECDGLEQERHRLEAGEVRSPPPPYTRDEQSRAEYAGAPLWQLVDFGDALDGPARAALEAGLESSGLLDAWVFPDGRLLDGRTGDRILVPDVPAAAGLGQVLRPAIDAADPRASRVSPNTVTAILDAVGLGEQAHAAWIGIDGSWRLGPARGFWSKSEAEYIGAGARETARRRYLRELLERIDEIKARISELDGVIDSLEQRRATLEQEWRAIPDDQKLRAAHQELSLLSRRRQDLQGKIDTLNEALRHARDVVEECRQTRDEAATDLNLPTDATELDVISSALADYSLGSAGFWPSLRRHWDGLAQLHEARAQLASLAERRAEHRLSLDDAKTALRQVREIFHTLSETLGTKVNELQRQLDETRAEIRAFEQQRKENEALLVEAAALVSRMQERTERLTQTLAERDQTRRLAAAVLQAFTAEGLLRIAAPAAEPDARDGVWPLDMAVRVARDLERLLHDLDDSDSAWQRHQRRLHEHFQILQQTLSRYGHEAGVEQTEDLILIRILFQTRPCAPDQLRDNLELEIAERRALLDAKERELLEEHLVSDMAGHLQELMGDGERMIARINQELEARPTSTGMKLRMAWLPRAEGDKNSPIGLVEARQRLLRQTAAAWSDEDRNAVGEFLQQRIKAVREGDLAGTLLEHLERALDYRHWHRFSVERWQNGRWRPAYGPASGGERALVVTLPLFAAASSHYGSAAAEAPRLVMLDEAFAGIDDDARAKCLGLMSQFDLDFVLTSEREWGCYAEVPGLSIAQLVRREGIDAVYVSRWTWDGKHRSRGKTPEIAMAAPQAEEPDLFAEERK